jgi:peptidoglycan/xylan/chitin deacetylase (PgdA/CDA1 family)
MISRAIAAAARTSSASALVELVERASSADSRRLVVLTYHRVDEPSRRPELYAGLVSATPAEFEAQVAHIAAALRAISLDELLAIRAGRARMAPGSVVITFDDAYRDVVEHAAPVLARHGVPSIMFVPTAYPDAPDSAFWWDRLHAALQAAPLPFELATVRGRLRIARRAQLPAAFRRLTKVIKQMPHLAAMRLVDELLAQLPAVPPPHAVASWDELRPLPHGGMALAPHSHTHARLDRLDQAALRDELERPLEIFRKRLGNEPPPVLAYPDGAHSETVVRAAADAGYRIGFTTRRGTNPVRGIDWLRVRRINVGGRSSLALIRAQLLVARRVGADRAPTQLMTDAAEEATTWN